MRKRWRELLEDALVRHRHLAYSRFVSLATVHEGRPANRTVTFRFFISNDRLVFTTDARSGKIQQLAVQPWAELCWYFSESRQQFRLSGQVQCVATTHEKEIDEARQRLWRERTDEARQSYSWPEPGKPRDAAPEFQKRVPTQPPENFSLLLLEPQRVELLDLRPQPHSRHRFWNDNGSWREVLINP